MGCNKEEATRAKEIAENKFTAKDIFGARKFALKAQNLFPGLEDIPQLLTTLDVYISAKNKINGEADWYGILGVDPLADDGTVRKQYRKLALMLHPDKNKSIGADGDFKLISEAWSLLSDKAKRVAYDKKINAKARKVSTNGGSSSAQTRANGSYNFTKTTASSAMNPEKTAKEHASSSTSAHNSKSNTFWTVCHRCKVPYEYLRVYLNLKLPCPNCEEAFLAVETAPPVSGIRLRRASSWNFSRDQQNFNHQVPSKSKSNAKKNVATPNVGAGAYSKTDSYGPTDVQSAPFSITSGVSSVAQAASVVQQAYEKVKREREEAQAAMKREETLRRKQHVAKNSYFDPTKRRRVMEDTSLGSHGNQSGVGNCVVGASNPYKSKKGNFEYSWMNEITKSSSAKDVSQGELQNILMEKAIKEISKKLSEIQTNTVGESTVVEESRNGSQKANEKGEKSFKKL